jgi:GDPmannose 4,6-dehydratase
LSKLALITGVNGQDGSYLSELLLADGYEVHGTVRRSSTTTTERVGHLLQDLHLHYADVTDAAGIASLVSDLHPDEVYNLAAMSDVRVSFVIPHYAAQATGIGALNVLEAVRQEWPQAKVYQAGSSEMFGTNPAVPCNELSRFEPVSPYAAAKVFAFHVAKNYREAHGMFVVNGLLFNHESARRGTEFVTRKITKAVGQIFRGKQSSVKLGNLHAKRDWGYAPEYMEAVRLMMARDYPDDYVIATGETHSVEEFAREAFATVDLDWREYVRHDEAMERPSEVPLLLGDASKARDELGWEPKIRFHELIRKMVGHDLCG